MDKIGKRAWFKYIVIFVVLLVPFMYSFFYLKAYWNPYGEGNMDNIPVAIVNDDKGSRGDVFASKLIDSHRLNFEVVSSGQANDGLINGKYYAVISIPSDFSSNIESVTSDSKVPALITYAPNQKTNYLASQIISRVLVVAEEEARGEVSSQVVSSLVERLTEVPEKMIKLSNGIDKIDAGSYKLSNGISELDQKYSLFNDGINSLYNGSSDLDSGINQINSGVSSLLSGSSDLESGVKQINGALSNTDLGGISKLVNGVNTLNSSLNGDKGLVNGVNGYVDGVNAFVNGVIELDSNLDSMISNYSSQLDSCSDDVSCAQLRGTIGALKQVKASINESNMVSDSNLLVNAGSSIVSGVDSIGTGVSSLYFHSSDISSLGVGINNMKVSLDAVQTGISNLNSGISKLNDGLDVLSSGSSSLNSGLSVINSNSSQIKSALDSLNSGSLELYNGVNTLKEGVDSSISSSKSDLSKLDGLSDFVNKSVVIDEKPVNGIDSYGTAFGPFFMSIALWVGSLMLFIILYYDASDRFKLLSRNASSKFLRTGLYLLLASLQGIFLGIMLLIGLDLHVTNYFVYFFSMVMVSCLFESIMEFLIVNLGDVGKFLSLILLVLQLAAAGGTFPIETVTKGFRFLNPLLPMKYTCNLFKESIMTLESPLLIKSSLIVILSFVILFGFNLFNDWRLSKSK